MRTVKVISTQISGVKELTTDVTNWGDLKPLLKSELNLSVDNMTYYEKDTEVTFDRDSVVLPEGDFILIATPAKVKSGKNQ